MINHSMSVFFSKKDHLERLFQRILQTKSIPIIHHIYLLISLHIKTSRPINPLFIYIYNSSPVSFRDKYISYSFSDLDFTTFLGNYQPILAENNTDQFYYYFFCNREQIQKIHAQVHPLGLFTGLSQRFSEVHI